MAEMVAVATRPTSSGEPSTADLLSVQNLTVRYAGSDGPPAVNGVDFHIGRGERVALVGESGSGKTTLGLATAGFLSHAYVEITSDRMEFEGKPMHTERQARLPKRIPGISMVFQDAMTSLDPVWTVGSQLRTVLRSTSRISSKEATDQARSWLMRVGLHDTDRVMKARPYELSGGMRQRVMLAIALCGNPKLVIADEPTSALDASVSRATMDLLLELVTEFDTSLLIVSHDIHLCMEYSERTMVMYHGDIVEEGPSDYLAQNATHPYATALLQCIPSLESRHQKRLPTLGDFMPPVEAAERIGA